MSDHLHVHESVRDYHKMIKSISYFHYTEFEINLLFVDIKMLRSI